MSSSFDQRSLIVRKRSAQSSSRVLRPKKSIVTATGDELRALRTRLAQTLRTAMIRIDFGPEIIVGRMRVEHIRYRIGISQGGAFPDGAPVTILDERPRVLTEREKNDYATVAMEDRARADDEMATLERLMAKSTE